MLVGGNVSLSSSTLGSTNKEPSKIIKYILNHHIFNASVNAIYLLLTTSDIVFTKKGLTGTCGYHDSFVRNGQPLKFAMVGDNAAGCTYGGTHMATGLMSNTLTGDAASPSGSTVADRCAC